MTDNPTQLPTSEESQPYSSKIQHTFSPVTVTDTVGATFLGLISLILILTISRLLIRNRHLEDRLRALERQTD